MSGLNIEIKANAGQATQQLEKVADALYEVQVNSGKVADGLSKAGRSTENTGKAAGKAADEIGKVKNSSNQANTALSNLGRVAQDAPFGFIGIQNNINPLLESFQRLKVETGSTSGALKSLAGSLMGGAGLGLAVSVATGVLTVMAQNGFFAASKAADKAKESVKEFNDQVTGIYQSSAKEQANVLTLVSALNDENLSRDKKVSALKELQKIAPEYFSGLKVENGLVNGLNEAYKKYSDSILEVIKNKIDEKRLESILNNIIIAEERRDMLQKGAIIQQQQINDLRAKGGVAEANNLERANKAIQTGLNNNSNLNVLYSQRDEILQRLAKRQFNGLIDDEKSKQKVKDVKTIADVLAEMERNLSALNQTEILFDVDKSRDKIKELENTIQTLFKDFGLKSDNSIIQDLNNRIKAIFIPLERQIATFKPITSLQIKLDEEQAKKEIETAQKKLPPLNVPVSLRTSDAKKEIEDFEKYIYDQNVQMASSVSDTLGNAFASIGESIGQSLATGANLGEAIFGNLFKVLGEGLKELGRAMIKLGTAKMVLEKFKFSPGIGTIIGGIAAIAAGALLSNVKLPGFANGVDNFGGGVAIVGERGPEIVRLPQGSDVIPNHRLNSMLPSSSGGVVIPSVTIRGSDLVLAFNRQTETNRRNG